MTEPQNVFQTPNPEALKKAAQADPIFKREGASETDVISDLAPDAPVHEQQRAKDVEVTGDFAKNESEERGQDVAEDIANRQTTIANLGGH